MNLPINLFKILVNEIHFHLVGDFSEAGMLIPVNDVGFGRPAMEGIEEYFLDNVLSREDLIEGLALLSPFADDALDIAKVMSSRDFAVFKLALPKERRAALGEIQSAMPQKFFNLLVPDEFMFPSMRSKEFGVSLGVMLWRSMEIKYNVC